MIDLTSFITFYNRPIQIFLFLLTTLNCPFFIFFCLCYYAFIKISRSTLVTYLCTEISNRHLPGSDLMCTLFQYIFEPQVNVKTQLKLIYHLELLHHPDFYSVSQPNTKCKDKTGYKQQKTDTSFLAKNNNTL